MGAGLHLARRYLGGLRRRSHVATVSLISLVSLALGVMALIVTLSLLEGFQSTIRRELVRRSAHAVIASEHGRVLEDPDGLASLLQSRLPDAEIVRTVRGTCLVGALADAIPARVEGKSNITSPGMDHILAARLALGPGDELEVVSPRRRLTPMGPVPVHARLEISTIVPPAPGSEGGVLLLPLEVAQRLLWGRPAVEVLELSDANDPWGLAGRARDALGGRARGLRVDGLRETHHSLLLALAMERAVIFAAVGLMLVVAALNLLCNVAMVAAEKRTDLAVVAGMGLPPAGIRRVFVLLGLGIGALGALSGATAGVALAIILDRTHALPLPRGVFIVSSVPFVVRPEMVAAVVALALALAAVAAWVPARAVGRRDPAEGLRYE